MRWQHALWLVVLGGCNLYGGSDDSPDAMGPIAASDTSIHWSTPRYLLTARDLDIEVGGVTFTAQVEDVDVRGDAGGDTYMTVEATWMENGVEMRLNIYLAADTSDWWVTEIRTYNGLPGHNADWIYYTGEFLRTPLGKKFSGDVDLQSDAGQPISGSIHFSGLHLWTFRPPQECEDPAVPYVLTTPTTEIDLRECTNCGYRAYVMLREALDCEPVVDQTDFSYAWSVDDDDVATIKPVVRCFDPVQPPCPPAFVDVTPETSGASTIHVAVTQISTGTEVAATEIPVIVRPPD